MRKIKFRCWIPEKKNMLYPSPFIRGTGVGKEDLFIRMDGVVCWCPSSGRIDKLTNDYQLMQFTGLTDKDGKEIYEGDILKTNSGTSDFVKYEAPDFILNNYDHDIGWWNEISEVIGNIYEHPELLEEK